MDLNNDDDKNKQLANNCNSSKVFNQYLSPVTDNDQEEDNETDNETNNIYDSHVKNYHHLKQQQHLPLLITKCPKF